MIDMQRLGVKDEVLSALALYLSVSFEVRPLRATGDGFRVLMGAERKVSYPPSFAKISAPEVWIRCFNELWWLRFWPDFVEQPTDKFVQVYRPDAVEQVEAFLRTVEGLHA